MVQVWACAYHTSNGTLLKHFERYTMSLRVIESVWYLLPQYARDMVWAPSASRRKWVIDVCTRKEQLRPLSLKPPNPR